MFGCIKRIIQTAIVIFAIIGFVSIGGVDFVKKYYTQYVEHKQEQESKIKSIYGEKISALGSKYEFVKSTNFMGYDIALAEYKDSGQKLAILESDTQKLLTEDDLKNGKIQEKLEIATKLLKKQHIRFSNLKLLDDGKVHTLANGISYVKFEAKVESLPFEKVKGSVGAYKDENGKNKILIGMNDSENYSQKVTDEYFGKIIK